jgi:hypothetical protein
MIEMSQRKPRREKRTVRIIHIDAGKSLVVAVHFETGATCHLMHSRLCTQERAGARNGEALQTAVILLGGGN